MNRGILLDLTAIVASGLAFWPIAATGQQRSLKEQLVGTWIYVSSTATTLDGRKTERPNLKGAVIYTSDGHFSFITTRTDVPKLASNDSAKPTSEEALAVATGSIAYFGTYTVDEIDKVIIPNVEMATFPNLIGAPNQKRIVTFLTTDELRFTNPRTPAGVTLEFVWRRAK